MSAAATVSAAVFTRVPGRLMVPGDLRVLPEALAPARRQGPDQLDAAQAHRRRPGIGCDLIRPGLDGAARQRREERLRVVGMTGMSAGASTRSPSFMNDFTVLSSNE